MDEATFFLYSAVVRAKLKVFVQIWHSKSHLESKENSKNGRKSGRQQKEGLKELWLQGL